MARVLVVDDEVGLRTFIAEALEGDGHVVSQAADGAEALSQLAQAAFDLLITDLRMPNVDGMILLRQARAEQPGMEAIVMTAHGSVDSAVEAMKLGAIDYLEKPVKSPAALRALVARSLERQGTETRGDMGPGRAATVSPAGAFRQFTAALADRYVIQREIGQGGTATVYLAWDPRHGRQVAIKVPRPELAGMLGIERFLREIAIVARLTHPHILPLVDSGEAAGTLYYIMPYAGGGSLREWLGRHAVPPIHVALRLASQVGAALDYAHRQGFVHRDIKPENILFTDGWPLVADFGIARAITMAAGDSLTAIGVTLGTPEYMSPEQVAGDRSLDGRSDEYSLAVVVFEMLTGAVPFAGVSARATMGRHLTEAPPRLGTRRPDIPEVLEQTMSRALAKNPADRFPTMAAFVDALGATSAISLATSGSS